VSATATSTAGAARALPLVRGPVESISNEVFKLTPSGSGFTFNVIYTLKGQGNGSGISGPLLIDKDGTIYSVAEAGGGGGCSYGCGIVFDLVPSGSSYSENILHVFKGHPRDGRRPIDGVIMNKAGTLFGTTAQGGQYRWGSVYELTPSRSGYEEHILYSFPSNSSDGRTPETGLLAGVDGVLYGTTSTGGGTSCYPSGCGTVFELGP
jgi:uncharacterized repeat protein (TIGR03803 family)